MQQNKIQDSNIFFPENSPSIISSILEKHGLRENHEKILEKLENGELLNGEIIAQLLKKIAKNEIRDKDFIIELKNKLNISQKEAENMFNEIKKDILSFVGMRTENKQPNEEKELTHTEDIYREEINEWEPNFYQK